MNYWDNYYCGIVSKSTGPSRAMKLGGKDRDLNTFVDKLKAEGIGSFRN